jgi:hypothetical protein
MADCLYKENAQCIKVPIDEICANCRIRLITTDAQFTSIEWKRDNGFVMLERSCHTCKHGIYESQEEFDRARTLICEKMVEAKYDGEIVDPTRYVCNLWEQGDML